MEKCITLLLLGLIGLTNALNFYVAAPSSLRLNIDEVIGIAIDESIDVTVKIEIKDYPAKEKTIFQRDYLVKQGKPQLVKIRLNIADIPPQFLTPSGSQNLVSLTARIQYIQKEILIPITSQYGYMFIQSDKPIYTPLERVSFRIIPLGEEGRPSNETFQFQIKNPDGIVVDNKTYGARRRRLPYYFATHHFLFPKYSKLGQWTALARFGHNLEQNSSLTFELQEYVLPTFIVTIKTPDVILPTHEEIPITVEAKYTYGKNVNGIVSFRFGIKKEHTTDVKYFMYYKRPKVLIDGATKVYFSTKELEVRRDIGFFPKIEGSTFVVQATVIDEATGNRVVGVDSKGRFSKTPFLISFKRSLRDFKPGLTSVFEADITYVNGRPAEGIPTKLTARADNRRLLNIVRNSSKSDQYGKVSFEIHPELHHTVITLELETDVKEYGASQAKGVWIQRAYRSANKAYIAISRRTEPVLRPNDEFKRDIYLEPKGIKNIYFLVVSRGRIQKFQTLYEGAFIFNRISFIVTHDMVPNFRVIVFAHHGNELVADSLKIEVQKECSPEAEVTLEARFDDTGPGTEGKIIMRGAKDTSVGIFGVDKAVYAFSKSDILRRERLFDQLGSHDLGCGPGGGLNVNSVLGNAGVMLLTNKHTSTHAETCGTIRRKKRSTAEDIANQYIGKERICCATGVSYDIHDRMCKDRYYAAKEQLEAFHENCSKIFLECCEECVKQNCTGFAYIKPGTNVGKSSDGVTFLDPEQIDELEAATTVRKDFKETWFNSDYVIGSKNVTEIDISLPHTITTWIIQAVTVSPTHGICVSVPKEAVSFKNVFLHINLPYSIKQYEQVEVQATVFNYGTKRIVAYVYMYETQGICTSIGTNKKTETIKLYIDGKSAKTVNFPIIPLSIQTFPIRFVAVSNEGSDVVERKLHIVPRGIRETVGEVIKLDPTNKQKRVDQLVNGKLYTDTILLNRNLQVTVLNLNLPEGTVPNTSVATITATGDAIGPSVQTTLNDPDNLIRLPHGCGEQTMMGLAPTIYTLRYLNYTKKLTAERKDKGYKFIREGYTSELRYKKQDGSYAAFPGTPTSTWLTAFVMKVFCQGNKFIPLDANVINSGIQWLLKNQQPDGSYTEKHPMIHRDMMGGVDGTLTMTAFALISLEECRTDHEELSEARKRATSYLETHRNTVASPLPTAIVAYALALTNSTERMAANEKLLSMATYDPGKNYLYWSTKNSAQDIETAGYSLLTQLLLNNFDKSTSIVNWLNTKKLEGGQFKSTQDTVIALQALSEYAITDPNTMVNLVCNLTSSSDGNFTKVFTFNGDNALEPQHVTIENPSGHIFVKTSGTGVGTLTLELQYNVLKPVNETCKFYIKETITEVENYDNLIRNINVALNKEPDRRRRKRQAFKDLDIKENNLQSEDDLVYNINICIRYLGNSTTEMSIADVGIFSGFNAITEDLNKLQDDPNHLIERYEKTSKNIIFYLQRVPKTKNYCFDFRISRDFIVGNVQSSVIKVYDYYNPDAVCTKFYAPDGASPLIKTLCKDNYCQCAEGGCPPAAFPDEVLDTKHIATRRDKMKDMFCQDYNYIWLGKLDKWLKEDQGYKLIPFTIIEVFKEGAEGKSKLQNQTRILRAHSYCETADFLDKATYLILGNDPENLTPGDEKINEYFLDKKTFVHQWASVQYAKNKDLQEDLEIVIDAIGKDGCG